MIVAGFGFRVGTRIESLRSALLAASADEAVDALATLTDKAPGLAPLAAALRLPLIAIDPAALEGIMTRTRSPASLSARGVGSVAEAVALAAAGPDARLLGARHVSPDRRATCALARGASQ